MQIETDTADMRWEILQFLNDNEHAIVDPVAEQWTKIGHTEIVMIWTNLSERLAGPVGKPDAFKSEVPEGALTQGHPQSDPVLQRSLRATARELLRKRCVNYLEDCSVRTNMFNRPVDQAVIAEVESLRSDEGRLRWEEIDEIAKRELRAEDYRAFIETYVTGATRRDFLAQGVSSRRYKETKVRLDEFVVSLRARVAAFGTAIFALLRRGSSTEVASRGAEMAQSPAASGSGRVVVAAVVGVALIGGGTAIVTNDEKPESKSPKPAVAKTITKPNYLLPYGDVRTPEKPKAKKKKRKKKAKSTPAPYVAPQPVAPVPVPAPAPQQTQSTDDGSCELLPEGC